MATSINGWPVLDGGYSDPRFKSLPIPGCPARKLLLRAEVLPLFLALAADYHRTIARLDVGAWDDWAYSYRAARFSTSMSDHSSGTAIDLNATAEGALGHGPLSWWKTGNRALQARRLKKRYEIVMWGGATELGGDYRLSNTTDWMHWALKPGTTLADVQRVIKKLGIRPDGTRPTYAERTS
jgi:hypothetical protein